MKIPTYQEAESHMLDPEYSESWLDVIIYHHSNGDVGHDSMLRYRLRKLIDSIYMEVADVGRNTDNK